MPRTPENEDGGNQKNDLGVPLPEQLIEAIKERDREQAGEQDFRKYTNLEIAKALKRSFGRVTIAARAVGCTPSTIYRRLHKTPELEEVIEYQQQFVLEESRASIANAARKGENWAQKYIDQNWANRTNPQEKLRREKQEQDARELEEFDEAKDAIKEIETEQSDDEEKSEVEELRQELERKEKQIEKLKEQIDE